MPTTTRGLQYPDSSGNTEIWTHIQNLATTADTAIGTATAPGPYIKLVLPANQSIPNNTNTVVSFGANSEVIKTDSSIHSTTVNTSRVTPNKAGIYEITWNVWWASNTGGVRGMHIAKNGTLMPPERQWSSTVPTGEFNPPGLNMEHTANGTTDFFEAWAFQNSGVSLDLMGSTSANRVCLFTVKYVRSLP